MYSTAGILIKLTENQFKVDLPDNNPTLIKATYVETMLTRMGQLASKNNIDQTMADLSQVIAGYAISKAPNAKQDYAIFNDQQTKLKEKLQNVHALENALNIRYAELQKNITDKIKGLLNIIAKLPSDEERNTHHHTQPVQTVIQSLIKEQTEFKPTVNKYVKAVDELIREIDGLYKAAYASLPDTLKTSVPAPSEDAHFTWAAPAA